MPRILAFVMDSAGVGALPDANAYHDGSNANTIGNVAQRLGGLRLPNFERLGLGGVTAVRGLDPLGSPLAAVGRLKERSKGKDTITGHWEMVGW
jgi:phosphopentomutase